MPRTYQGGILSGFRTLVENGGHAYLVLVGQMKEGEQELRRLADELGISQKVIFAGFVDDYELRALYSGAKVYACPSLYEGFGFTVLEAMACGTAVVCAGETSLPEVGGDAALYADARNPEEFGEALHKVFTDASLRGALIEKGRKNLRRFSWANTAKETLGVYEDALRISSGKTRLGLNSTATSPQKSVGSN